MTDNNGDVNNDVNNDVVTAHPPHVSGISALLAGPSGPARVYGRLPRWPGKGARCTRHGGTSHGKGTHGTVHTHSGFQGQNAHFSGLKCRYLAKMPSFG